MSRILRRPMFRGGRVDSRGTGITSGLGYAKGGQVQPRQNFLWGGLAYIPQALAWGSRMLPAIGRGWKAARYWKPGSLGTWGRTKSLLTPGQGLNARMAKSGEGAGFRIGSFSKENPLTTFGITSAIPQTTYGGFRGAKKGVEVAPEVGKSYIDLILPGDQSGWFKKEEEGPPEETPMDPELAAALAKIEERDALIKLMEEQAQLKKDKTLSKEEKIAKIKENEEMFREVYGSGRGEDATAMLLNFAGKALKPGADTKSAFGEFFEEESKRPSERKKYKDAAAQAAIQAFLAGETSYNKFKDELELYKDKIDIQTRGAKAVEKNKSFATIRSESREQSNTKKNRDSAQKWLDNQGIPKFVNETNSKKVPTEELFVEENIGEYFIDQQTGEFFLIDTLENGEIGKIRKG